MKLPFTISGFFRFLKLKLMRREILISGGCRRCGACCRKVSLDIGGSWVKSESQYRKLVSDNPDYERFTITGRDPQGHLEFTCSWLQEEGSCRDYENRLKICDGFPDKRIFFMNGSLPGDCGYSIREGTPFEKVLEREVKNSRKAKK
jgi:uncharacterized protein